MTLTESVFRAAVLVLLASILVCQIVLIASAPPTFGDKLAAFRNGDGRAYMESVPVVRVEGSVEIDGSVDVDIDQPLGVEVWR